VNCNHPGVVQDTGIVRSNPDTDLKQFAKQHNLLVINPNQSKCSLNLYVSLIDTSQGSVSSLFIATDPSIEREKINGKYFNEYAKIDEVAPQALDDELAKQLWNKSEAWTGFKYQF
jgi:subtilase family serine protease